MRSDLKTLDHEKAMTYTPKHSKPVKPRTFAKILKGTASVLAVVLASGVSLAAITTYQLASNVKTVALPDSAPEVKGEQPTPTVGAAEGGVDMLIIASDTREGQDATFGETESELADVIMYLHVSDDHTNAVVTSFPRDLMIDVPECTDLETGEMFRSGYFQINSTLSRGGAGCTLNTVEQAVGVDIPYVAMVDFNGVIEMSNAVGGVDVCVVEPIRDSYTGVNLDPGTHNLKGLDAVQFLRTRHGVGDGSDLSRISVQQVFLSALARKVKSDETLTNPATLYGLARAATSNVTLSENLVNVTNLVSLAKVFEGVQLEDLVFLRVPVMSDEYNYPGRVVLDDINAETLFAHIRDETPVTVSGDNTGTGSVKTGSVEPENSVATPPLPEVAPTDVPPTTPDVEASAPAELSENSVGQKASDVTCAA